MKTSLQFGKLIQNAAQHLTKAVVFGGLVLALNNCIDVPASVKQDLEDLRKLKSLIGRVEAGDESALAGASVALTKKVAAEDDADTMELGRAGGKGVLGLGRPGRGRGVHALVNKNGQFKPLATITDDEGETCEDIASGLENVVATDCTDAEGDYDFGALECGTEFTLFAKKGSFMLNIDITVNCEDTDEDEDYTDEIVELDDIEFDEDCGLSDEYDADINPEDDPGAAYAVSDSCDFDIANMAVITGEFDQIENVLAKLGYGEIDASGRFDVTQPYDFTIVDGTGALSDEEFMNVDEFLTDADLMSEYDIIFINCGIDESSLAGNVDVQTNLMTYVSDGGKLYVTDWSYGFLENTFPWFINFYQGGEDHEHAETYGEALEGTGGITVDADVKDSVLADWLDHVAVNNGSLKNTCQIDESDVDATVGARNIDGTITIGGFLDGWALAQGKHEGFSEDVTVHLKGIVSGQDGVADYPLTLSTDFGDGKLLYSSYHTAHDCPTTGFWPQERVLQYLVFEL
jgi:hypothetical protein